MNELENIIDQLSIIIETLDDKTLNKIYDPMHEIHQSIDRIIRKNSDILTLDTNDDKHTYYVNNLYAKYQLKKLVGDNAHIVVDPAIEIGNIIMVKQY